MFFKCFLVLVILPSFVIQLVLVILPILVVFAIIVVLAHAIYLYPGLLRAVHTVWEEMGVRGFFVGLAPRLVSEQRMDFVVFFYNQSFSRSERV